MTTHKPTVLVVDDDDVFRGVLAGEIAHLGFETRTASNGTEAIGIAHEWQPEIVLLDLRLPDQSGLDVLSRVRETSPSSEVIMLTGHGSIDTAIESIRMGAFDYVAKPCPLGELEIRLERAVERRSLKRRATLLERGLTPPDLRASFIGASPGFRQVMQLIERVAPTDSSVLVTGETGCGKEMVAKLLHARSRRAERPFVVVECAALQETLLQSELFGHERGAFTGADRAKPGLFEVAHGGTIFLDEIGEVSQTTQVKLLRVLDTSTFRRVGGTQEIRVDVRIVAATNRNLPALVRQGTFREDLYYRLSTIALDVPSLRERPGDVELLATHFLSLLNDRLGTRKRLGAPALDALTRHDWPGNVRELRHAIEAAVIVCDGPEIALEHLPSAVRTPSAEEDAASASGPFPTLQQLEDSHIERALQVAHGHRSQAARMLGISERNLYRKLKSTEGTEEAEVRKTEKRRNGENGEPNISKNTSYL
jgi:DNA-binding NtrC family response regulator